MAEFIAVRFKNLLGAGNAWSSFRLNTNDAHLIIGSNGVGKSQIIDAISFALYKQTIRKLKLNQIVNSINRKDMVVELIVKAHGDTYVIRRGLKPNLFEIIKNGEPFDRKSQRGNIDDQDYIEQIIVGMSFHTFKQTMVLTKTRYVPFMSLTTPERRAMVEDILDMHVYGVMAALAKEDIKSIKEAMSTTRNNITVLQTRVSSLQRVIEISNENRTEKLDLLQTNLADASTSLTQAIEKRDLMEADLEKVMEEIRNFPVDVKKANEMMVSLNGKISESHSYIMRLRSTINSIKQLDCCPTCRQDVHDNHRTHIETSLGVDIEKARQQIQTLQTKADKLKPFLEQYKELSDRLSRAHSEIQPYRFAVSSLESTITNLTNQIQKIIDTPARSADEEKIQLQQATVDIQAAMADLDEASKQLDIKTECVKIASDSGIKAQIVSKYIPKINELINYYLSKLDMFVEFTLDEEFNETIKSRYRDIYTYESFSEGQKARIDLALLLTWREIGLQRNSITSNLMFFDETFDGSMDKDGNNEVVKLLKSLTDKGMTVYVISHSMNYRDKFDKVIEATMEDNFSIYTELS